MSTAVDVPRPTDRARLDEALARLRDAARPWAEQSLPARIALARRMLAGVVRTAGRGVAAALAARGLTPGTPPEGEEWLASPYATVQMLRETIESLEALQRTGNTPIGPVRRADDGHLTVAAFPASRLDAVVLPGVRGEVHLEAGVDEAELRDSRARFYKRRDHDGKVCLVLGAGNVNSIPPTDVVSKLFSEGKVCLLKMNPVNAYLGPVLEEAFADAVAAGVLAVVYGGAEEGAYLAHHPAVDEVHITGSDRTHDTIVWGPPGPERAERMARGRPLLEKEITSELGNVTPVLVVPRGWTDRELAYQADDVAGMVTHNASFNCVAGKMLVLPRGWEHRERFLDLVAAAMARTPARRPWYPGAEQRYQALTAGRPAVRRIGEREGALPWTIVSGLEAADASESAFRTEPFCAILSETQLGGDDPVAFLAEAARFANERLWGTLSAAVLVSRSAQRDPAVAEAVERAIRTLRYGIVTVNLWPGMAFPLGTLPWGAYPGSSLTDIQSGRGFVHNTRMLERVEKSVLRGPAWSPLKLPYFASHRSSHLLGPRLVALEAEGSWTRLPGVVAAALRG